MDELLQQLAGQGLNFDPNDPQFQRIFLANKASQKDLIMASFRRADEQEGHPFDEEAAGVAADEEVFGNSLKQFLTESGQLPAMQQSQIARQTGQRLQTEQDPAKAEALRGQLQRLQRISGLNMNQEQPVGALEEGLRGAAGAAANIVTSPGRFVGKHIGVDTSGLEAELAKIEPARVSSPVGRFAGETAGTMGPFAAASSLPLAGRLPFAAGPASGALAQPLGELVGSGVGALGRFVPGAGRLAPELGGGAVTEALKATARTAIPNAAGGAAEMAAIDPSGTEQDPAKTLLMGALLGQGRTVGDAASGARIGSGTGLGLREKLAVGDPEAIAAYREHGTGRELSEEDMAARTNDRFAGKELEAPAFLRREKPLAPTAQAESDAVIEPSTPVKGYDLASQIDREIGGANEDLQRARITRLTQELRDAREKRQALLLREQSTNLTEPQRDELLAQEGHLERIVRDLQSARESLRGGSARGGAPFRALEEARRRVGKPKRRKRP